MSLLHRLHQARQHGIRAAVLSAATIASVVAVAPAIAAPAHGSEHGVASAHGDILAQSTSSWNGKPYTSYPTAQPQLTVLKMTIPAHTALPWHTHPFPNAGYVLSGQLTIEDKPSGQKHTFHTGEAFTESVNDVHRGISGDTPTVLIITYSGVKGVPTFTAEPGQKPEY